MRGRYGSQLFMCGRYGSQLLKKKKRQIFNFDCLIARQEECVTDCIDQILIVYFSFYMFLL